MVELFDDGLAEHGDIMPKDGVYSARWTDTAAPGTYLFEVTGANAEGRTAVGETFGGLFPPLQRPVPPYLRAGGTTVLVTGAGGQLQVPGQVDFGIVPRGRAGLAQLVLSNANASESLAVTVYNAAPPFSTVGSLSHLVIPPRGSESLGLNFVPQQRGAAEGQLTILSGEAGGPKAQVRLVGSGR
jgi:hypothetical protein